MEVRTYEEAPPSYVGSFDPHVKRCRDWLDAIPGAYNKEYLYRIYGEDEELLYIGKTGMPYNRWSSHRGKKAWWSTAVRIELWECTASDRTTAEMLVRYWESKCIDLQKPIHNKSRTTIWRRLNVFGYW